MQSPCLGCSLAVRAGCNFGSAILPVFLRSPALTAMTAAGLDFVSSGRFILGLGASGPQVVQGWHGVAYDRPLLRTRETIDVCRLVWAREKLQYDGKTIELPGGDGRPLKLLNQPVRPDIPIYIAALGAKNVALAAEVAQGWLPIFFHPDRHDVWALLWPKEPADEIRPSVPWKSSLADRFPFVTRTKPTGSATPSAHTWRCMSEAWDRLGKTSITICSSSTGTRQQAHRIQELYLSGKREEAEALVPADYLRSTLLVGDEDHVRGRIEAYRVGRRHVLEHRDPRFGGRPRGTCRDTAIVDERIVGGPFPCMPLLKAAPS